MTPSLQEKTAKKRAGLKKTLKAVEYEKNYLKQHLPLLKVMSEMSPEKCQALMPFISENSHHALCTCVYNTLKNYNKFDEDQIQNIKTTLSPKMEYFRYLSNEANKKKTSLRKRASVINQVGYGLPLIIGSVLPLLTNLLFGSK
jgi:hypothetical protein